MWIVTRVLPSAKAFLLGGLLLVSAPASLVRARDFTQDSPPPASLKCDSDTIVWVNTKTGVYHFRGMTWYGHTKQGKYMCKADADREGDRPTQNGQ